MEKMTAETTGHEIATDATVVVTHRNGEPVTRRVSTVGCVARRARRADRSYEFDVVERDDHDVVIGRGVIDAGELDHLIIREQLDTRTPVPGAAGP